MFGKGGLGNMMQQAQKMQQRMQENMKKLEEELSHIKIVGESGAGLVKVTMDGNKNVCRVKIDNTLLENKEEQEMLEDLVAAAVNDAYRRAEKVHQEKMSAISGDLGLPPGFKMPF